MQATQLLNVRKVIYRYSLPPPPMESVPLRSLGGGGGGDAQQGIWQEQTDKPGGEVPPSHTVFSVDAESLGYRLGQDRSLWLFHFLL